MLNKLDLHPNAAMNRWIIAILIFDFKLVYVPGTKHKRPDRLSKRRVTEGKEEGEGVEETENWVDKIISCGVWVASKQNERGERLALSVEGSI